MPSRNPWLHPATWPVCRAPKSIVRTLSCTLVTYRNVLLVSQHVYQSIDVSFPQLSALAYRWHVLGDWKPYPWHEKPVCSKHLLAHSPEYPVTAAFWPHMSHAWLMAPTLFRFLHRIDVSVRGALKSIAILVGCPNEALASGPSTSAEIPVPATR